MSEPDEVRTVSAEWDVDFAVSKAASDYEHTLLQLANTRQQINLLRCLSHAEFMFHFGLSGNAREETIMMISSEPMRLQAVLSANASQFLVEWVTDFVTNPVMFAAAVMKTFPEENIELRLMAHVTFPAIFQHFMSCEFLELGEQFLMEYVRIAPFENAGHFFCSFLASASNFCEILWRVFDEKTAEVYPAQNASVSFGILLNSIKVASGALTAVHLRVIKFFAEYDEAKFANILITEFFLKTFLKEHCALRSKTEVHPLVDVFGYAVQHYEAPHYRMIYEALFPKMTKWLPGLADLSANLGRITVVLSRHEALLIEEIAVTCPEITKLKYVRSFAFPRTLRNDFTPMQYQFSVSNFIKRETADRGRLFGHVHELEVEDDPSLNRSWNKLALAAALVGTKPLAVFGPGASQLKCFFPNIGEKPNLYDYGVKVLHNQARQKREKCCEVMRLLTCKLTIDKLRLTLWWQVNAAIQRYTAGAKHGGTSRDFPSKSLTSVFSYGRLPTLECLSVPIEVSNVPVIKARIERIQQKGHDRYGTRTPVPGNRDSGGLKRGVYSKLSSSMTITDEKLLPEVDRKHYWKSSLVLWLCLIEIEETSDNEQICKLSDHYRELVDVQRLLNPKIEESCCGALPFIKRCVKIMDSLSSRRISAAVVSYIEFSNQFVHICHRFFSYKGGVADMMKIMASMSKTNGLFETFLACERLLSRFPELKKVLPTNVTHPTSFIREATMNLCAQLDADFVVSIVEYRDLDVEPVHWE